MVLTLEQKALEQKELEQKELEQKALEQKALEQISKLQSKVCFLNCPIMCSNKCRLLLTGNRILIKHMLMYSTVS